METSRSVPDAGSRPLLRAALWALAFVLTVTAPIPANAGIGDFLKNLFGGGEEATPVLEGAADAADPDAPAVQAVALSCPEDMVAITGLSENCGTDRPPAPHGLTGGLAGLWDVEAPGNPFHVTAMVSLNRGFAGVGHRGPQARQWVASGVARESGKEYFRTINPTARSNEDGSLYLHLLTGGYCGCVPYTVTVKPTGNPGIMVGEWAFDYQKAQVKKGIAILRRRPASRFDTVRFNWISSGPTQGFVRDEVPFGTRPLKVEGRHPVSCGYGGSRSNCGGIWLAVRGMNLAGGHDVWIDPASHIEIHKAGWRCANGEFRDHGADWTRCGSRQAGGDGVIGLGFRLLFRDGMAPGPKTLWIDGHPIHLEVVLEGYPEDEMPAEPPLVLLDARDAADKQISEIREGEPFQVTAIFEAAHPRSWISVAVPTLALEAAGGDAAPAAVVLRRTGDPKVFQSEWLAVEAGRAVR